MGTSGDRHNRPFAPIALDAALLGASTGIGLYAAHLVAALEAGPLGERIVRLSPPQGASRTAWMLGQVASTLKSERAALFHGLANFDLPLTKPGDTRYVLTVHDLIPLEWPATVSRLYRLQFELWLGRCLQLADAVICVSAAIAAQVRARYPQAPALHVVHHGADHVMPREPTSTRSGRPYFLYVGTLETRKNLPRLLGAFADAQLDADLVLLGHLAHGGREILRGVERLAASGVAVRWIGGQPRTVLEGWLQGALALAAPSSAEGFGLPGLEALALGVPVIASDIPAHREVLGDAALLVPDVGEAWVEALRGLLSAPGERTRLRLAGRERAKAFTWAAAARATEAVYKSVLPSF